MARDATRPSVRRPIDLLEEGRYRSAAEIAEAEGVTRSFVNRVLRLTLLAPDIVEAILNGRQPKGLQLRRPHPDAAQRLGRAAATPLREIGRGIFGSEPRRASTEGAVADPTDAEKRPRRTCGDSPGGDVTKTEFVRES